MKRISLTHIVSKVTFLFFGLRGRLLALVLFAAVPAVVITILNAIEERRLLMESKQHALQTLVRTASNDFVDDVRTAGYLLTALSKLPEITEAKQPVCSELLKQFAQQEPRYAAFLIADRRGNGLCGTEPLHTSTNYSDRPYFQKALKSRALVVG